ncbi:MAG: hypothetical protein GXP37_14170 [Chloroflexi bacterium]|nr:hypothetical protein [Chloroflexota bacterium]
MKVSPLILHLDLAPYAGKYIALVEGRVVAVAGTAADARVLARMARPQRQATLLRIAPTPANGDVAEAPEK